MSEMKHISQRKSTILYITYVIIYNYKVSYKYFLEIEFLLPISFTVFIRLYVLMIKVFKKKVKSVSVIR